MFFSINWQPWQPQFLLKSGRHIIIYMKLQAIEYAEDYILVYMLQITLLIFIKIYKVHKQNMNVITCHTFQIHSSGQENMN